MVLGNQSISPQDTGKGERHWANSAARPRASSHTDSSQSISRQAGAQLAFFPCFGSFRASCLSPQTLAWHSPNRQSDP